MEMIMRSILSLFLSLILSLNLFPQEIIINDYSIENIAKGGEIILDEDYHYPIKLTSTGNGNGISMIIFQVSSDIIVTLDGTAKFYSDVGGTQNESSTWEVTSGALRTKYIRCPSGTSNMAFDHTKLIKWGSPGGYGWSSSTNAASINCDISIFINLTDLSIKGNNTISGSLNPLQSLAFLYIDGSATIYSNNANWLNMYYLYAKAYNRLHEDISNFPNLVTAYVSGQNELYGSVTGCTLITSLRVTGYSDIYFLTGNISGMTNLNYCDNSGYTGITYPNVNNVTHLCYFKVPDAITLSRGNIDTLLYGFWQNRNASKPISQRTIDLRGSLSSDCPSDTGYAYIDSLEAYKSPDPPGTAAYWTVLQRDSASIFFGTSITYGLYTSDEDHKFINIFSDDEEISYDNLGISGRRLMINSETPDETSMYENINDIPNKCGRMRYLFFEFGANDVYWSPFDSIEFRAEYKEIIDTALARGWDDSEIKLLTCFHVGTNWQTINRQISVVGTAKNVQVIDTGNDLYNEGDYSSFMYDNVHPNDAGHAKMSAYIIANIITPE